jgi:phosphopantetheinyl transferase (holo-ACP synthase)
LSPVGNDVVDLAAPGNIGKSSDARFCGRVFTVEERTLIAGAACPDALLWAIWAAKEAAYKAVSRDDPAVCSIPQRYRVVPERNRKTGALSLFLLTGKVITPRGELALRIDATEERVHAVAAGSEGDLARLCRRVDRLDGAGDPSAFVRKNLLREIARSTGCPVGDLRVVKDPVGPGVPRVLLRGRLLTTEISLSHDVRFTAFAFAPVSETHKTTTS